MRKKMCKIAVVGMAGVFPGAEDTRQFLDHIIQKKNAVIPVPDHRWVGPVSNFVSKTPLPDKAVSGKAGLIERFSFDPNGFHLDKHLVSELDTLHKLVLHAGRQAFLQCSHTKETQKNTGVILAAISLPTDASSFYSWQVLSDNTYKGPGPIDFINTGAVSLPAAILARAMGFQGGSFTLDAACASSLYAIKLACEHLHLKKTDIMVAGGVSRPDSLYTQIGFSQLQALSPSGICAPFDKTADGLVVGEGTGIVVLKRLDDAIASNDKIHAVITGAGVSNDIEGTLVKPASEGQVRAMIQAYEQASWRLSDIQYMECHGSGTPVGDQVELASINSLRDTFDCQNTPLSIGSVKSMTGHLLTAAGAAGFIKTVLSMNKGILPPSLNYSAPAPDSILNHSKIKVQTKVEDWLPASPASTRKAGISAFGFGGINAHLLVEEFRDTVSRHVIKHPAKTERLKPVPCAIIGMEAIAKNCDGLSQFQDIVFGRAGLSPDFPGSRWKKTGFKPPQKKQGFYLDHLATELGEFHIPPNQLDDILPQHILLLKAVKGALKDADINPRPTREDAQRHQMGCAIGIEFDYGATDFHLRWKINDLDENIKDNISPPLTFNRTLGALGGIVASRVAREFKLGGPCFTLSAGAASGIKTIETAIHSLSAKETDTFVCGCVDLAGDIRQSILNDCAKPYTGDTQPSEGAAAIILKRLDQAIEDNDHIYGVITGVGGTGSDTLPGESDRYPDQSENLYAQSLKNALSSAKASISDISLYEVSATGIEKDNRIETDALNTLFRNNGEKSGCRITSVTSVIGNTRAASSLFSVIKTALCLNFQLVPSNKSMLSVFKNLDNKLFDFTDTPVSWSRQNRSIRKACAASITLDGCFSHVILEEHSQEEIENPLKNIKDQTQHIESGRGNTFRKTAGDPAGNYGEKLPPKILILNRL